MPLQEAISASTRSGVTTRFDWPTSTSASSIAWATSWIALSRRSRAPPLTVWAWRMRPLTRSRSPGAVSRREMPLSRSESRSALSSPKRRTNAPMSTAEGPPRLFGAEGARQVAETIRQRGQLADRLRGLLGAFRHAVNGARDVAHGDRHLLRRLALILRRAGDLARDLGRLVDAPDDLLHRGARAAGDGGAGLDLARALLGGGNGRLGGLLDLDEDGADLLRGLARALGEPADLARDDGEALAVLPRGRGGLDGGVQREHVDLARDVADDLEHLADAAALLAEDEGLLRDLAHALAGAGHPLEGRADGRGALRGDARGVPGGALHVGAAGGDPAGRLGEGFHAGLDAVRGGRLLA